MTFKEAVRHLEEVGIADAACEARLLFSSIGKIPAHKLYTEDPRCDDPRLTDALARRLTHEPLAYILGEVSFFKETYRVTPSVLIPRADTEILVEAAIRLLPPNALFYDFCTGSGCIAVSVLASRPDCRAVAFDISKEALAVARENAALNGVSDRLDLRCADLLSDVIETENVAAILSNPPYIAREEAPTLAPELAFEPQNALFAEEDGLIFYRHFLEVYAHALENGAFFLFEIGYTQRKPLEELAKLHNGEISFIRDFGGIDRVALYRVQTKSE